MIEKYRLTKIDLILILGVILGFVVTVSTGFELLYLGFAALWSVYFVFNIQSKNNKNEPLPYGIDKIGSAIGEGPVVFFMSAVGGFALVILSWRIYALFSQ